MNFSSLQNKINNLKVLNGVDSFLVGLSAFGQEIWGFHVGSYSGRQVIMEGGIHAREYLSTLFLIKEIEYLNTLKLNGGFYVIPLVNPDGVRLVLDGADFLPTDVKEKLIEINGGSNNFSQWKANANAVDLNVNFDAEWGKGASNVFQPSSGNFVGYEPNSEPEVKNLIKFAESVNAYASISWHTKGEVIYYGFYALTEAEIARDYALAKKMSAVNNYAVVKTGASVGGFSDWIGLTQHIPAFTIELGPNWAPHPLNEAFLNMVFEQNKNVPPVLLN